MSLARKSENKWIVCEQTEWVYDGVGEARKKHENTYRQRREETWTRATRWHCRNDELELPAAQVRESATSGAAAALASDNNIHNTRAPPPPPSSRPPGGDKFRANALRPPPARCTHAQATAAAPPRHLITDVRRLPTHRLIPRPRLWTYTHTHICIVVVYSVYTASIRSWSVRLIPGARTWTRAYVPWARANGPVDGDDVGVGVLDGK